MTSKKQNIKNKKLTERIGFYGRGERRENKK